MTLGVFSQYIRWLVFSLSFSVAILAISAGPVLAQDAEVTAEGDTLVVADPPWDLGVQGTISASQVAYKDWAEGGLNTLSLTIRLDGDAERFSPVWEQRHRTRLGFGIIQQDTMSVRKAEDRVRMESSLRYIGGGFFQTFNPTVTGSVRTQFAVGFNYDRDPFDREPAQDPPVKVSDFMAPAHFRQSLGLTVDPNDWFEQRLAFAGQETVVTIPRLRTLYGLRDAQSVRFQGGMEAVSELDREIANNIRLRSTLNLFSAFDDFLDPDMIWESVLNMQVNEWLSVDLELTAIYEPDVRRDLQLKEVLSLGVSVAFI